jgi:SAM-dependent methyltransferase
MGLGSYITRQRNKYASDLLNSRKYWSLSALTFSYFTIIRNVESRYIKGKALDAGAGGLNGKALLTGHCSGYVSLDITSRNNDIDIIWDIQKMDAIGDDSFFDAVYSSQVLEHVLRPWEGLSEIYRVLRRDGYAIISVPHLSGLHEEPYDFYRYTPYGLKSLMEDAGFTVEAEYRAGGLISFLSHRLSLVSICLAWRLLVVRWAAWWLNKALIVHPAVWLDRTLRLERKFPANIVIVGRKR